MVMARVEDIQHSGDCDEDNGDGVSLLGDWKDDLVDQLMMIQGLCRADSGGDNTLWIFVWWKRGRSHSIHYNPSHMLS